MTGASEHHRYQISKQDIREHGDGGHLTVLPAAVATSHFPPMPNVLPFPMALPGGDVPSSPASSPLPSRGPGLFPALPLLLRFTFQLGATNELLRAHNPGTCASRTHAPQTRVGRPRPGQLP